MRNKHVFTLVRMKAHLPKALILTLVMLLGTSCLQRREIKESKRGWGDWGKQVAEIRAKLKNIEKLRKEKPVNIKSLSKYLDENVEEVVIRAVRALSWSGNKKAIPILEKYYQHDFDFMEINDVFGPAGYFQDIKEEILAAIHNLKVVDLSNNEVIHECLKALKIGVDDYRGPKNYLGAQRWALERLMMLHPNELLPIIRTVLARKNTVFFLMNL